MFLLTAEGSDSDTSFTKSTNRGNKLKRKAKYVREGRLAQADGPQVYKRVRETSDQTKSPTANAR